MEGNCSNKSSKSGGLCRTGSGESVLLDSAGVEQAESKKLPSSKYKGVVPQPNGRWGAQIYEKHQRVWLGTFNEEDDAARVYDVAAQRFRGRDAVINFKPLSDAAELAFLASHSKPEIVDMLRKHTYHDELHQSKRHYLCPNDPGYSTHRAGPGQPDPARHHLFEKVVTPSDVGKLNRLVIPKQHAEKHFPVAPLLLNFEDADAKVWRFRYSYWNSSQSYVLTKGWSRFVKEKALKAGDVVIFQRSAGLESQLFIDFKPRDSKAQDQLEVVNRARAGPGSLLLAGPETGLSKIRLFGVDISSLGKRLRQNDDVPELVLSLEMMSSYTNKKQMVAGALS